MNLKDLIEQKLELTEEKAEHDGASRALKERIDELDYQIMGAMEDVGIDQARAGDTTVFIQHTFVPQIEDWNAFYEHVHQNRAFHLLERRPAVRAWREEYEGGNTIPGTEPFEKISLGKRTTPHGTS